jgi:transcriptional regulator GlxA family with amidase domain
MSNTNNNSEDSLIYRLRKRAEIRRSINSRKSVQEGKADRISDLLEEAAEEIYRLETLTIELDDSIDRLQRRLAGYDY